MVKTKAARRRHLVKALRSGEYNRTQGVLEDRDANGNPAGNCCLGVACRVAMKDGLDLKVSESSSGYWTKFDGASFYAPPSVVEWYGFASPHGGEISVNKFTTATTDLAQHNDNGRSFEEIADVIEAAPEGLFV